MSTAATKRAVAALNARFPNVGSMGIYNRRRINCGRPSCPWSQHAWGNGVDITSPPGMLKPPLTASEVVAKSEIYAEHMAYMDEVYRWLLANQSRLNIRNILWRRYLHWNHIHIDFNPKKLGTPPIITGPIPEEDEETMKRGDKGARVELVQKRLLAKNYELPKWGADADFGEETELAVKAWQTDVGLEADGVLQALDIELLFSSAVTARRARIVSQANKKALSDLLEKIRSI